MGVGTDLPCTMDLREKETTLEYKRKAQTPFGLELSTLVQLELAEYTLDGHIIFLTSQQISLTRSAVVTENVIEALEVLRFPALSVVYTFMRAEGFA